MPIASTSQPTENRADPRSPEVFPAPSRGADRINKSTNRKLGIEPVQIEYLSSLECRSHQQVNQPKTYRGIHRYWQHLPTIVPIASTSQPTENCTPLEIESHNSFSARLRWFKQLLILLGANQETKSLELLLW